jgi:hypothetical protein
MVRYELQPGITIDDETLDALHGAELAHHVTEHRVQKLNSEQLDNLLFLLDNRIKGMQITMRKIHELKEDKRARGE